MNRQLHRVSVGPGADLVGRAGSAVVLAAADPRHQEWLTALLRLVDEGSGTALVRRVGRHVLEAGDASPSVGLIVHTGRGVALLVAGDARGTWSGDGDSGVLDGADSTTFAERLLPDTVGVVELSLPGATAPDDVSDLAGGTVRGSAVRVVLGHADTPAHDSPPTDLLAAVEPEAPPDPEPVVQAEPEVAPEPEPVVVPEPAAPEERAAPPAEFEIFDLGEPPEGDGGPTAEPPPVLLHEPAVVEGIHCSRGHFNSPRAIYCSICGIAMVHATHRPVRDTRPPLGVLVTDDGLVFSLDGDYVIGRDPGTSDEVQRGAAMALVLEDPALSLSRVHAHVRLEGWDVYVEDARSANGTFVATGDEEWSRIAPGQPTRIEPGTRIGVGGRSLSFESHQRA